MSTGFPSPQYSPPQQTSQQSNKTLIWAVVAIGFVLVSTLVCCGGIVGLGMVGLNVVAEEIKTEVRDHPVVVEEIGEVKSFEIMYGASLANDDEDTFVYSIEGSKGSGELTVRSLTDENGMEVIDTASLRTSDGRTIELEFE